MRVVLLNTKLIGLEKTVSVGTNRNLFHQTELQNAECQQLFFDGRPVSKKFEEFQHLAIQTKTVQHFGRFFHQMKVCQPIGRKNSIQTVIRTSRRGWIHFCMKRLRTLKSFKIFKSEIKKSKTYRGLCPFHGLFNDTTFRPI